MAPFLCGAAKGGGSEKISAPKCALLRTPAAVRPLIVPRWRFGGRCCAKHFRLLLSGENDDGEHLHQRDDVKRRFAHLARRNSHIGSLIVKGPQRSALVCETRIAVVTWPESSIDMSVCIVVPDGGPLQPAVWQPATPLAVWLIPPPEVPDVAGARIKVVVHEAQALTLPSEAALGPVAGIAIEARRARGLGVGTF